MGACPAPCVLRSICLFKVEIDVAIELICCTSVVMRLLTSVLSAFSCELVLCRLEATPWAALSNACREAVDVGLFATSDHAL